MIRESFLMEMQQQQQQQKQQIVIQSIDTIWSEMYYLVSASFLPQNVLLLKCKS